MRRLLLSLVLFVVALSTTGEVVVLTSPEDLEEKVIASPHVWVVLFQAFDPRRRLESLKVAEALARSLPEVRLGAIGVKEAGPAATEFLVRERSAPKLLAFVTRSRSAEKLDLPKDDYTRLGRDIDVRAYTEATTWLTEKSPGDWAGKEASHVPVVDVDETGTFATVEAHHTAMTNEHHVSQLHLFVVQEENGKRTVSRVGSAATAPFRRPVATFPIPQHLERPLTIFAVADCNLHGSWASQDLVIHNGILQTAAKQLRDLVAGYARDKTNGLLLKATLGLGAATADAAQEEL